MNKIILMGRLTRDPEVRYTAGDAAKSIARFSLAVDKKYKTDNGPTADFFNCIAFGKTADFAEKYLRQGNKILITGRISNDNYTDRNGNKVYSVQVIVEELEFAESKKNSSSTEIEENQTYSDGFLNIPDGIDEEMPFND